MGLLNDLFKTKEQREEDLNKYYAWAYPYGQEHKERISKLIEEFVSDDDSKFAIYNYLVCRQALAPNIYDGKYIVKEEQFAPAYKKLKKEFVSKGKKNVHKYMALVEADLIIDEEFNYPSLEQLTDRANQIKDIIDGR